MSEAAPCQLRMDLEQPVNPGRSFGLKGARDQLRPLSADALHPLVRKRSFRIERGQAVARLE